VGNRGRGVGIEAVSTLLTHPAAQPPLSCTPSPPPIHPTPPPTPPTPQPHPPKGATNLDIIQEVEYVKEEDKLEYLLDCLQKTAPPVLIFAENKKDVDAIHEFLLLQGVDVVAVHGDKDQEERLSSISGFKGGVKDVLVATDVASKGLDFPGVQHVINYDMPDEIENYVHRWGGRCEGGGEVAGSACSLHRLRQLTQVSNTHRAFFPSVTSITPTHRIGRTGRSGKTGVATTFVNTRQCEESILLDLKHLLREAKQRVPQFLLVRDVGIGGAGGRAGGRGVCTSRCCMHMLISSPHHLFTHLAHHHTHTHTHQRHWMIQLRRWRSWQQQLVVSRAALTVVGWGTASETAPSCGVKPRKSPRSKRITLGLAATEESCDRPACRWFGTVGFCARMGFAVAPSACDCKAINRVGC